MFHDIPSSIAGDIMRSAVDPCHERFLKAAALFRGNMSANEVDEQRLCLQNKNPSYYFDWSRAHASDI